MGDLSGKVTIITGGYSGIGLELTKLLYQKNCTVYIAGRRTEEASKVITTLKSSNPTSKGRLEFLLLDLADLSTIKTSVTEFLSKEKRLDILWNNAGVLGAAKGSKSKQGHDLFLATHCLGPFLLTQLLHPTLTSTATASSVGSVRVLWVSSIVTEFSAAKNVMDLDNLDYKKKDETQGNRYAISKTGNVFIGTEWAKKDFDAGIVHLIVNPGNLKSPLQRNMTSLQRMATNPLLREPINGAYTQIWAGISPTIQLKDSGRYVLPWGRFGQHPKNMAEYLNNIKEGPSKAAQFFEFCEKETRLFL